MQSNSHVPSHLLMPGAGSDASEVSTPAHQFGDLLTRMSAIARGAGRSDLVDRLEGARSRVLDPRLRIVVVGPLGHGKSSFVNSLIDLEVCTVGDDECTAVPTVISYAPISSAELVLAQPGSDPLRVAVPIDALADLTPATPLAEGRDVLRVEVAVPSALLADGLVMVDTPGVGGHGNPHAAGTLAMVASADAVLVVSDAGAEFTDPELSFLRQVVGLCPTTAVLVTKTDLYPHWRRIVEANIEHLRRERLDVTVLPVSSVLRTHALRLGDSGLDAEAGFADLYAFLREQVVARADVRTRRTVALDLRSVSEHLALALGSELAALRDPATADAAMSALVGARRAAEEMRRHTSLWQQTLVDGITDLAADIDHDLRERLRVITREAEQAVDEGDPGRDWPVFGPWLEEQVANAVGENFVWAHDRSIWLTEVVAEHFADTAQVGIPDFDIATVDGALEPVTALSGLESGRMGIASKVLVGMRGSYGGVLMFGLLTTFAGLALINPISIGAGVLLGTKAYRDDKDGRVQARRHEAKMAVRAYTDDVSFQVGKESKDRLRLVQRVLRDHFTSLADQALRSIDESLRASHEAGNLALADRAARVAEVETELHAVAALRTVAAQLDPAAIGGQG